MNNLHQALKQDLIGYTLGKNEIAKNILRVVIGELDNLAAKGDIKHDDCLRVIRKCVESNNEMLKIKPNDNLVEENKVLSTYLPNNLNVEQIKSELSNTTLGNHLGKAIGNAVKILREKGLYADGKDVRTAVEQLMEV